MTEDEMVGRPHRLNGYEFEQILVDSEGQGSLVCCSPRGCNESDMTERLKSTCMVMICRSLVWYINHALVPTLLPVLQSRNHYINNRYVGLL